MPASSLPNLSGSVSGTQVFNGSIDYLGSSSLAHVPSIVAIVAFEIAAICALEAPCVAGGPLGSAGVDPVYPSGAFDPVGMASDPDAFAESKVKEIKNRRLAMFSFMGYYMQAFATGKGPVENWPAHIAHPDGQIITTFHDGAPANIAMFNYSGTKDRVTCEHLASYYGPERKLAATLSVLRRTIRLRSCAAVGPCLALLVPLPLRP